MKGVATLDTGLDNGEGTGLHGPGFVRHGFKPLELPPGWSPESAFTQAGVKASLPKHQARWLLKLRKQAAMDKIVDAVADALDDDETIDDILGMLDVPLAQTIPGVPDMITVSNIYLESDIRNKSQTLATETEPVRAMMEQSFDKPCETEFV